MSALYSLLIILLCLGGGYLTHLVVDLIPPSLYGMFYLATGLHLGIFSAAKMESTINWIIRHMGVCFVPAGVGIMNYFGLIQHSGLQILLFTIATTIAIMVLVGAWYQRLIRDKSHD